MIPFVSPAEKPAAFNWICACRTVSVSSPAAPGAVAVDPGVVVEGPEADGIGVVVEPGIEAPGAGVPDPVPGVALVDPGIPSRRASPDLSVPDPPAAPGWPLVPRPESAPDGPPVLAPEPLDAPDWPPPLLPPD
jgi:hypothetical protein